MSGRGASDELVLYEKDGGVAWLTLNRPSALNAVNLAMRDRLWSLLEAVRAFHQAQHRVLQHALVVVEGEVHRQSPSTALARMFFCTSLLPP